VDQEWLNDKEAWEQPERQDVPFLDEYARETAVQISDDTSVVKLMRQSVLTRLDSHSLSTTIEAAPGSGVGVPVRHLIGSLSYSSWLNDACVFLTMSMVAARYPGVVVIDPLLRGKLTIPASRLKHQRLVVFPLNMGNVHWCCVFVRLDWYGQHSAVFYDPQCSSALQSHPMNELWLSWGKPLLDEWLRRDEWFSGATPGLVVQLGHIPCDQVLAPKQTDGSNCGVLCIAQATCYMAQDFALQEQRVLSPSQLCLMRLRIMYMLLNKATTRVDEEEQLSGLEAISLFQASRTSSKSTPKFT
jgi:hypothetical protein